MRELGFRVLDKETNDYGLSDFLILDSNGKLMFFNFAGDNVKIQYVNQKNFVVEHATGVLDKNGKMIYVGDIIRMRFPYDKRFIDNFVVVEDKASPYIGLLTEPKCTEVFVLARRLSRQYEIIGDIHHNPELLEENEDA
nr:MAG TPA: YopX protein [Caudoviricetes sp.]DAQ67146.1 MAG TPA: YopX protein [Caudoviricetes sp.]